MGDLGKECIRTGERLHISTVAFQATCVDYTVIPFVTGKLNAILLRLPGRYQYRG